MKYQKSRKRVMAGVVSGALAIALAGCGATDDSDLAADPDQEFEGAPVTVMTIAPVDTAAINTPEVMDAAVAAVRYINDGGGLDGHEVRLIACNDGNDANQAGECARKAVEENVIAVIGGFTTNGATIMPILQEAGIPWIGGYGLSPNELSEEGSFLLLAGAAGFAGVGAKAVDDGCESITTVAYEAPTTASTLEVFNAGIVERGGEPATNVKVPTTTTDFSSVAKSADEAECAVLGLPNDQTVALAVAAQELGLHTQYYAVAGLSYDSIESANGALDGAKSMTSFALPSDPAWDDAKEARPEIDWSSTFPQNTWAAYRAFAQAVDGVSDLSAESVMEAMSAATSIDADGLVQPIDFSQPFGVPGLERVFNRRIQFVKAQDGELVADGDYMDIGPLFGQ